MAAELSSLTRRSSSDSSALSNILVASADQLDKASDQFTASTPPTSVNDTGSLSSGLHGTKSDIGRRPKRVKSNVSSYNLKKLAKAQDTYSTASTSRNVSGLTGRTLVAGEEDHESESRVAFGKNVEKALDMEWELKSDSPTRRSPRKHQRRPSVKERVKRAAGKVGSVLGKRGRDMMEAGKRKLGMTNIDESPQQTKVLKQLDTGRGGVLDELDLDADFGYHPRPKKKQKIVEDAAMLLPAFAPDPLQKTSDGRKVKKWQNQGLYVGQNSDKTALKKRLASSSSEISASTGLTSKMSGLMTLPMFNYLDKTRDFIIPFDIYAPTAKRGDEKPKDWHKVNRNRLIGDAKDIWAQTEKLQASVCVCTVPGPGEQGCGEDCLNRIMQYECNGDYCNLTPETCSNRAFADLAARVKKGGAFDVGVEVIKTSQCGFGVRSCRTFAPGQIIMEYTGEIISEGECQRRMREEYKDKQCYYLMELERGLVIDGTKGSMARFINHSCAPNCEVRMMKVNGYPRMAVFAGDDGIMTGEELTYDYNFDNFGTTQQKCYCGAPTCRGFLSKRLNAVELKKLLKEEAERARVKAEEAQKRAAAEARKKQTQNDRGANWKGWLAVDDPEVKERLRAEKRAKEEASGNSDRARRLAARRETLPAALPKPEAETPPKKNSNKRRRTIHVEEEQPNTFSMDGIEDTVHVAPPTPASTAKREHNSTTSLGSKFTDKFSPPVSDDEIIASPFIRETKTETSITTRETVRILRDVDTAAADVMEDSEGDANNIIVAKSYNFDFSRTAAKGKETLRNVSQAIRHGLKAGASSSAVPRQGQSKLKQSKLSFATLS